MLYKLYTLWSQMENFALNFKYVREIILLILTCKYKSTLEQHIFGIYAYYIV